MKRTPNALLTKREETVQVQITYCGV